MPKGFGINKKPLEAQSRGRDKSAGLGGWIAGFHSKLLCDLSQDTSHLQALPSDLCISPRGTRGPFPLGESVWALLAFHSLGGGRPVQAVPRTDRDSW